MNATCAKAMDRVQTQAVQPQKSYNTQECSIRIPYEEFAVFLLRSFEWIVLWAENILEKKEIPSLFHNKFVVQLGTR